MTTAHVIVEPDSIAQSLRGKKFSPVKFRDWLESDGNIRVIAMNLFSSLGYSPRYNMFLLSHGFVTKFNTVNKFTQMACTAMASKAEHILLCSDHPLVVSVAEGLVDNGKEVTLVAACPPPLFSPFEIISITEEFIHHAPAKAAK